MASTEMAVQNDVPLAKILKSSDILMAVGMVTIVIMMVIPLPGFILDLLIASNLTLAMLILLLTLYMKEPLEFSVFPSILLIMTLFRLALNVSSTRLILLQGKNFTGQIIRAFGDFVVGGNYVVGLVIFAILVVIQFVVITKGSNRVAEVAARFTLDAMPGKQMSIDADLNAGLITDQEAKARRLKIQREADFYGAMDGAAKFVVGDAIAGIVITAINIIGGIVIGVWQHKLSITEAAGVFTLFTVGDGLVAQIPALLISTATGIIVTRAASETHMGDDVVKQFLAEPRPLMIATGLLVIFALIPGLPKVPFLILGSLTGYMAFLMQREARIAKEQEEEREKEEQIEEIKKPESVVSLIQVDSMELEIGYSLIPLVDPASGGDLLDRVTMIRRQCALELGLIVPPIRIRDNMQLKANTYTIKIRGVKVAEAEIMLDSYLAMNPGTATENLEGIETKEPAFGLKAYWIGRAEKDKAERLGYTVVDPPSIIATHLSETIKKYAADLLDREGVKAILETVAETNPTLIEEIKDNKISYGDIQKVLAQLLKEKVSIRNIITILETIIDKIAYKDNIEIITEFVRQNLKRQITQQYATEDGILPVITLSPNLESTLEESVRQDDTGGYLNLDPSYAQRVYMNLSKEVKKAVELGYPAIILCSPAIRPYFKKFTERIAPDLIVLSYNEVTSDVEVRTIGMVNA